MALYTIPASITVATTPVKLMDTVPSQGGTLVITNGSSAAEIYIGLSSTVSSANGAVIPPYGSITLHDVVSSGPLYAVAASGATVPIPVGVFYGDLR